LQWVQTYSSTRSLCSIERSNTPTDQYLEDLNFVRAHHYQNNSRRYHLRNTRRFMFGPAGTNAIQVRKFQNNRRCSLSIENEPRGIAGDPPSCDEPYGEATRLPGCHGILATLPGESRYGENRGKKKRLSEENPVGEVFFGRGRTCARVCVHACVRACMHAPFDLPPIAQTICEEMNLTILSPTFFLIFVRRE
jgi:hypothetical protein